jgi:hypothetical protein
MILAKPAWGRSGGMPWVRYFLYVGGVLLALLFVSDALLPNDAVEVKPVSDHPAIRIHSDRKWPERVVFDTNRPTIVPPQSATITASAPTPVPSELGGNGRARNAYAALDTPDPKQAQSSDPAKLEKKLQRKRRIAKRRVAPPMMVAQQPQFGFFGNSWNSTW